VQRAIGYSRCARAGCGASPRASLRPARRAAPALDVVERSIRRRANRAWPGRNTAGSPPLKPASPSTSFAPRLPPFRALSHTRARTPTPTPTVRAAAATAVQLDVSIELITMVAAVAALVAALFGMNLASGVDGIDFVNETERNWSLAIFWIVTALSLLFLVAVPVIGMALMRRYFLSS